MTAAKEKAPLIGEAQDTTLNRKHISNADFLRGLFPALLASEYGWACSFAVKPAPDAPWAGFAFTDLQAVQDYPHGNGYFSTALLTSPSDKPRKRRKDNFSRLPLVVVDDFTGSTDCTYRLQTSTGKFQVGWKLSEPITNVSIAERLFQALGLMDLMPADKSGNNLVRYVRLPVQINTKYQPHFFGDLEYFEPEQVFTLEAVCELLGINYLSIVNKSSKVTESRQNAPMVSAETYVEDAELIRQIQTSETYHDPLNKLIARYAKSGMDERRIVQTINGFMLSCNDRSERWEARLNDIERSTRTAIEKFAPALYEPLGDAPIQQYHFEPFCDELLNLPGTLGDIQEYIFNAMQYPSRAEAGFGALVAVSNLSQRHRTIESGFGLGFNEFYLQASPTGFGKESVRRAIANLSDDLSNFEDGQMMVITRPKIHWKLPPSQQGIHKLLEADNAILIMTDEFAEWLAASRYDTHKQEAVGYLLELYTSATRRRVTVPQAVTIQYTPVDYPRVTMFGSTTPDRLAEAMTGSHARSGTYNRMVILVSDEAMPQKRYDGQQYDVPAELKVKLLAIGGAEGNVTFSESGRDRMIELDGQRFEKMKYEDPLFAARLMEQTIKLAAVFAVADTRAVIESSDMDKAAAIRLNLYMRLKCLVDAEGVAQDFAPTSAAQDQLTKLFMRHPSLPRSRLADYSRKYRALGVWERKLVIDALERDGIVRMSACGRIKSMIFEQFKRREV